MAIFRLVLLSLALSLGVCFTASAHECWWNGYYWVCPPRMPEWHGYHDYEWWRNRGYTFGPAGRDRDWDRERDWHRHEWRERYPYERRDRW